MSEQHTPGRLKLSFGKKPQWAYMIKSADGTPIAYFGHYKPMTIKAGKANARRLVACWNLLVDVPTEEIEAAANYGASWGKTGLELAAVTAQRDELLEALETIANSASDMKFIACAFARAVIAKVEGVGV